MRFYCHSHFSHKILLKTTLFSRLKMPRHSLARSNRLGSKEFFLDLGVALPLRL